MSEATQAYQFERVSHDNPCYCERMPEQLSTTNVLVKRMYVTINNNDRGAPFEIFVRYDDPAYFELTSAVSRLASMALREGVDPEVIAKELQDIHSPNTNHIIPGTSQHSPSLTARIGAVLARHLAKQ